MVSYRTSRERSAERPRECSIMERLKNLEDENAAIKASIARLTELIQGKETR